MNLLKKNDGVFTSIASIILLIILAVKHHSEGIFKIYPATISILFTAVILTFFKPKSSINIWTVIPYLIISYIILYILL